MCVKIRKPHILQTMLKGDCFNLTFSLHGNVMRNPVWIQICFRRQENRININQVVLIPVQNVVSVFHFGFQA